MYIWHPDLNGIFKMNWNKGVLENYTAYFETVLDRDVVTTGHALTRSDTRIRPI